MDINFFLSTIDGIYELVQPTFHSVYYQIMNKINYSRHSHVFTIYIDYYKIDDIFVNGDKIEWEVLNPIHPLKDVVATTDTDIEIHYSNLYSKNRYIVQDGENVENICNSLTYIEDKTEKKEFIIYAKITFLQTNVVIEYSKELNEYITHSNETMFFDESFSMKTFFQWNKMYIHQQKIQNCSIFIIDFTKTEHSFVI